MIIDFKELNINNLSPKTEFQDRIIAFIDDWFSEIETVKIQTSGSTGIPKIFEVEKSKMSNSATMTCDFLGLKQGDLALICLPVEYISGKMMVVRSIERKLKLKILDTSLKPLKNLSHQVDFCAMTPLQVENSLDKIHLIKNLIIGGATVSESLKKKIYTTYNNILSKDKCSNSIYETYGMSETLSHIALKKIYPISEDFFSVLEGVNICLDERGCLNIDVPKISNEQIITNDLVEIINNKQFKFLGRLDNVINSGGAKIFPEQLEALVKKNILNEIVFLGIPDEILGQKLIMVIEGYQSQVLINNVESIKFEKSFHKPKEIIFIEKIPRTPNGKVNRKELLFFIR